MHDTLAKSTAQNYGEFRVGIIQRVLPHYRLPFFNLLSKTLPGTWQLISGDPSPHETLRSRPDMLANIMHAEACNRHIFNGKFYICWQAGLIPWLKAFKPDILVVEANPRLISNYIAILWAKIHKRKIIGWGLGTLPSKLPPLTESIRKAVHRAYYGRFDAMIGYSSKAQGDYIRSGVEPTRVFIAYNAVDTTASEPFLNRIKNQPGLMSQWKSRYGLDKDKVTVLSVGRLERRKRIDRLIHACIPLRKQVQLLIVGDGPARAELEDEAHKSKVHSIFTGACYGEDLSYCFATGDIFVMPGLGGLATQQAMSYGKPVIAGKADGTEKDLVKDSINGYLIEPSTEELSKAIQRLAEDAVLRAQMSLESLSIIKKSVNLNRMAQSFIDCIQYVLNTNSSTSPNLSQHNVTNFQ